MCAASSQFHLISCWMSPPFVACSMWTPLRDLVTQRTAHWTSAIQRSRNTLLLTISLCCPRQNKLPSGGRTATTPSLPLFWNLLPVWHVWSRQLSARPSFPQAVACHQSVTLTILIFCMCFTLCLSLRMSLSPRALPLSWTAVSPLICTSVLLTPWYSVTASPSASTWLIYTTHHTHMGYPPPVSIMYVQLCNPILFCSHCHCVCPSSPLKVSEWTTLIVGVIHVAWGLCMCAPSVVVSFNEVCVQVTHLLYALLYSESLVIRTPSIKCHKHFVRISENTVNYMEQRTWRHDLCLKIAHIATSLTLGRYNYVNDSAERNIPTIRIFICNPVSGYHYFILANNHLFGIE